MSAHVPAAQSPHPGTARDEAVFGVPRAAPSARAGDVRATLAGRRFASATEVAVLEGERFVGLVAIEDALAAPDATLLGELVATPVVVGPEADLESAARTLARRGARCIAVVDAEGRFYGLVPPGRLLQIVELEHEEDLARIGGFLSRESAARTASEEAIPRRLWHRLPWLIIGLFGAMAASLVVGAFEEQLRKEVLLAFFVPAVVYMSDAVGTQTETVVIRGMALGVSVREVVARELVTGVIVGVLLGSLFFPFVLVAWGDLRVAGAVALSLMISCSIATAVAMALPSALARLGHDPAFGAGPLATVIQDLLAILAYFAVAILLVT